MMEMLTPKDLRQDAPYLGLVECYRSPSSPEDRQVELQKRGEFYKSQDIVRHSLVISGQVYTHPVGSFCSEGDFWVWSHWGLHGVDSANSSGTSFSPSHDPRCSHTEQKQGGRPRRWMTVNLFSMHGTNGKSQGFTNSPLNWSHTCFSGSPHGIE